MEATRTPIPLSKIFPTMVMLLQLLMTGQLGQLKSG
jgi:hypothetical protein